MNDFARRRRQLLRMMGENAIAIIPSAPEKIRSRDTHFPFRQDSDFWYLTGFPEPEAVAVLVPGRKAAEYILFCREKDAEKETWHGRRAGQEGAIEIHGADDAFPIDDIDDILPGLMENRTRVYYTMGAHPEFDSRVIGWVKRLREQLRSDAGTPHEFVSLDPFLHDLRLYKSAGELKLMRRAAQISAAAHERAMRATRPGMMEWEIEAELLHEFRRHGGHPAYSSIVGGGANACILHYVDNDAELAAGDLLLVDAGCEYRNYASDISRTWPVNGKFTPEQRALYEIVLEAQLEAIDKVRAGEHWNAPHEAAVKVITRGLVKLGILEGRLPQLIRDGAYRRFYMHKTGHWLGLDVHDVGDYKVGEEWRVLEPGMVMTVEPGIYIAAGMKGVDAKWWNTGIRIEDDVAVTRGAPEVLTAECVKDPGEIEKLMAG
ncbi:MAG TPA: Xaa-Pro aminopeptidase [Gammaproteobacteria bacterium]|nr:Xaa-Pro aminopeptidase [Gammaproteobacteria bacterium]